MRRREQRLSDYFGLGVAQAGLDFVNIDVVGDTKVFIEPNALHNLPGQWASQCRSLAQHFFQTVLDEIRAGNMGRAQYLLEALREPNETHLGLSRGRARGHALGPGLAREIGQRLTQSRAVLTGVLRDLEDSALMIRGIDKDIVSDILTNIIREPLIRYTQKVAVMYGLPTEEVDSGPLWNPPVSSWHSRFEQLPVGPDGGRLLLVPKVLVRQSPAFSATEYYRHYLLNHLRDVHLQQGTLVHLLKDGRRRVYKTDLERHYGSGKDVIVDLTIRYPQVLKRYKDDKNRAAAKPLEHEAMADATDSDPPDWDVLLTAVTQVSPGRAGATQYHLAAKALLTALFYPSLTFPEVEREIHEGRKRIDILFTNTASTGFFEWVAQNYIAPYVPVECKNYAGDPQNPELDQLAGRFSNRRGRFGLLVCRSLGDRGLFTRRCRDTADDGRGFIVALDDSDLADLVKARKRSDGRSHEELLRSRYNDLVL